MPFVCSPRVAGGLVLSALYHKWAPTDDAMGRDPVQVVRRGSSYFTLVWSTPRVSYCLPPPSHRGNPALLRPAAYFQLPPLAPLSSFSFFQLCYPEFCPFLFLPLAVILPCQAPLWGIETVLPLFIFPCPQLLSRYSWHPEVILRATIVIPRQNLVIHLSYLIFSFFET